MTNGPGGTEVGRVYIRVLPNTAEFAAKLKAAIKGMQDKVEIDVTANTTKAKAQIEELSKKSRITVIADADTAKAKAAIKRLDSDKQITIQARALTAKAAAELDALMHRQQNLNIRVNAVTAQAAVQLKALSKERDVTVKAHINNQSIAKAQARINALERRRQVILGLDTKQVNKKYNTLKVRMRYLESKLKVKTDPKQLAQMRAELEGVTKNFKVIGDIKLRGREAVAADIRALQERYNVIINARTAKFDRAIAKIDAAIQSVQDKKDVTIQALFDGAKAKGEFKAWKATIDKQFAKVAIELETAKASVDWETYKAMLEQSRLHFNSDLDTARAAVQSAKLKRQIEAMRVQINADLAEDSVRAVQARLTILSREYKVELDAVLQEKHAKASIKALARERNVYFKAILETKKAQLQFNALDHDRIAKVHVDLENSIQTQAELIKLGRRRSVEFHTELKRSKRLEAELDYLTRDRTVHVKTKVTKRKRIFDWLTKEIGVVNKRTGLLGRAFGGLADIAASSLKVVAGGMAQASGEALRLMKFAPNAAKSLSSIGEGMVGTAGSMTQFIGTAISAALALSVLSTIAGVCVAVIAGLSAAILAVVAALLGMVLALVMLAAVLIGALVGVVALLAVPGAFIAGTIMMIGASKKLKKEFQQLTTAFKETFREAAKPWTNEFKRQIPKLTEWLRGMKDEFRDLFEAASKHLDSFRIGVQNFVEDILPGLTKGLNNKNFAKFTKAFSGAMGTIGKAIGGSFNVLAQNGDKFAGVITEIGRGLGKVLPSLSGFLASLATNAPATGKFADGVAGMFDELAASFNSALQSAGWEQTVEGVRDMMKDFGDAVGTGFEVAMQYGPEFKGAFQAFGEFFQGISEPLAAFTGSAAGQFAEVMPSVTEGMIQITESMTDFTEAFAEFAPDVVAEISDAIADLFDYLARPDVASQCAEITKAFVQLAKTALGPATLDAILSITQVALDLLNKVAPLIPLLIKFFAIGIGFKVIGAMAMGFGGNLLTLGSALSGAGGKAGKFGAFLLKAGTNMSKFGTMLKGGVVSGLTAMGKHLGKIGIQLGRVAIVAGKASAKFLVSVARMSLVLIRLGVQALIAGARMAAMWIMGLGPIGWLIIAIAAFVAIVIIYWDEIVAYAKIAWEWIKAAASVALEYIKVMFSAFITYLQFQWTLFWTAVQVVWALIWATIQSVLAIIVGIFQAFIGILVAAWNLFVGVASAVWNLIVAVIQGVINIIVGIFGIFVGLITGDWGKIKAGAATVWAGIRGIVQGVLNFLKSLMSSVAGFFKSSWNSIKSAASGAWSKIKSAFSGAMSSIKSAVSSAVSWIIGKFNGLKDKASAVLSKINPANWFSAPLDLDVNLNVSSLPSMGALSVPVGFDSPTASTFSSLSADNPWRQDFSTLATGIDQANYAFNSSVAIAGMFEPKDAGSSIRSTTLGGTPITVNVETNADPVEIGREVAWALRRK